MFKPGDRVRMNESGDKVHGFKVGGRYGTLVHKYSSHDALWAVSWDGLEGHSCEGYIPNGYGWNVQECHLELAEPLSPFDQSVWDYITRELGRGL